MNPMNPISYEQKYLDLFQKMDRSTELVQETGVPDKDIQARLNYYYSIPQPAQKSQAWLDQRTNYITASAFGTAISDQWNFARTEMLKEKVSKGEYRTFFGNEATRWGEKYEDLSNAIYCYQNNVSVVEYGMIAHLDPDLYFLGASTDGVSSKLVNIEIKSPFSRVIKPGKVKPQYWKQMQLQMAVLDLEITHFIECKFKEYSDKDDFWDDFYYEKAKYIEKGIIIEYVDHDVLNLANQPKTMYMYAPIEYCTNDQKLRLWLKKSINKILNSSSQIYVREHYWRLSEYSCVNVARDRKWFAEAIPKAKAFWKEVEYYRANGGIEAVDRDFKEHKKQMRTPPISPDWFASSHNDRTQRLNLGKAKLLTGQCLLGDDSEEENYDNDQNDLNDPNNQSNKPMKFISGNQCLLDDDDPETSSEDEVHYLNETKHDPTLSTTKVNITNDKQEKKPKTPLKLKKKIPLDITLSSNEGSESKTDQLDQPKDKLEGFFPEEDSDDDAEDQLIDRKSMDDAEYSSGSDTENDSPPARPANPKPKFYRRRKKSP